jgi:hypothetical protein
MVSYARARGEGLGLSTSVGFFGRGERIVTLGLGSVVADCSSWFQPAATGVPGHYLLIGLLGLLALGVHISALQRSGYLARHLR